MKVNIKRSETEHPSEPYLYYDSSVWVLRYSLGPEPGRCHLDERIEDFMLDEFNF